MTIHQHPTLQVGGPPGRVTEAARDGDDCLVGACPVVIRGLPVFSVH
jgi:hypothetical protein